MKNMLRVAAVTPKVHIGSVSGNVREIMDIYEEYKDAADVIVTPELSITGYTCADLFENRKLIDGARRGLLQLAMATCTGQSALVVGLPLRWTESCSTVRRSCRAEESWPSCRRLTFQTTVSSTRRDGSQPESMMR